MGTLFDRRGPVADVFILVEDQTVRTSFVMLDLALADVIFGAHLLVTMEGDDARIVLAQLLLLLGLLARDRGLEGTLVGPLDQVALHLLTHGLDKWVLAGAAIAPEVVQIH